MLFLDSSNPFCKEKVHNKARAPVILRRKTAANRTQVAEYRTDTKKECNIEILMPRQGAVH